MYCLVCYKNYEPSCTNVMFSTYRDIQLPTKHHHFGKCQWKKVVKEFWYWHAQYSCIKSILRPKCAWSVLEFVESSFLTIRSSLSKTENSSQLLTNGKVDYLILNSLTKGFTFVQKVKNVETLNSFYRIATYLFDE